GRSVLGRAVRRGRRAERHMHEEGEERRREDERRRLRGGERSVERGFRVAAVALRTRDEIEMFYELPAGLPHEARVVALRGLRPGLHRKDREHGAAFDDLLRQVVALPADEALAL